MICKYCGNEVDDNAQVCPVCNSPLYGDDQNGYVQESLDLGDYSQTGYDQSNYDQGDYAQSGYDSNAGYDHYGYGETNDTFEEDPFAQDEKPAKKGVSVNLPKVQAATVISAAAAIFSFICLVMVCMVNANLKDRANTLEAAVAQVQMSYSSLEERIGSLDSTVANVQQEAYNQLASTSISITKDITSLTGPVSLGKYNMMFIIKAKGNLNLNTSFEWQKYNSTTGGWEEIVFTGKATSNDQYGLRLENLMENGEYKSVLWANGITKAAEGTYRCVISDVNGIKKTSSEASVSVADAQ
mgnify:FL=1